jgi:hypothetical protein
MVIGLSYSTQSLIVWICERFWSSEDNSPGLIAFWIPLIRSSIGYFWTLIGNLNSLWFLYGLLSELRGCPIMVPYLWPLEHIGHLAIIGSNLSLAGYNGMISMIWLRLYGKDLLLLHPQYEGGVQNYALYVVTWVVGKGMWRVFLRKKNWGFPKSLMSWKPWLRSVLYPCRRLS